MTQIKTTVEVLNKEGYAHTVLCGDKKLTLQLGDRVQSFYKSGLMENRKYEITYDDETNLIMFARICEASEQPVARPTSTAPSEPVKTVKSAWEDKSDVILAQVCLKVAAEMSKDTTELFETTKQVYWWMKEKNYEK
ncbi:MAG: hypothetical protein R3321_14405 [Nitrososphaeraceae archaeon]|nr:hypothetical protein [Nitrososphaeraceae archaeon]